jgi:4'-phosphopantetheinyl transferase
MTQWGTPSLVPELPDGQAHVWWARLADARPELAELLSPVELRRRARYRAVADQNRFLLGAALLRVLLGGYQGMPAADVEVVRACPDCGEPHGKTRSTLPGWECSVSHSGDRVAVAVSRAGALGVDVERVGQSRDLDGLAGRVLHRREAAALRSLPEQRRPAAFTAYWTRKEAVVKATGDGLRAELAQLEVSPPGSQPRVLAAAFRPELAYGCALHELTPGPGYAGTLALLSAQPVTVLEFGASGVLSAVGGVVSPAAAVCPPPRSPAPGG